MSEERFYRASVCGDEGLYDIEDGCIIINVRSNIDLDDNWNNVVDLLNNQAETITHLEEEIGARENDLTIVHRKNKELQTRNLELNHMNEQLRKINKEIGDDLYNCRLNKNTISELISHNKTK